MKQEEKDRILESFPGLGKDEKLFKYLCYLAYAGEVPSWLNSYQICGLLKVTKETVKRDYYEILIKGGYISDNKVSPKWLFKVLLQMLDSFPKWAETFNKLSGTRYESTEYLWNIAVFLHRGGDTLWSLACEGIQNLYAGNLSAAREKFALALTLFAPNDHAFDDTILTYFYGLCIYESTLKSQHPLTTH